GAATLAGFVERGLRELLDMGGPLETEEREAAIARTRAELGDEAFVQAAQRGTAMSWEQIRDYTVHLIDNLLTAPREGGAGPTLSGWPAGTSRAGVGAGSSRIGRAAGIATSATSARSCTCATTTSPTGPPTSTSRARGSRTTAPTGVGAPRSEPRSN